MKNNSSKGYVAITSAIIVFGFVVTLALAIGFGSFITRTNIGDSYYKDISHALADACADTAFLKLANNGSYAGGETITVASDTCSIVSVVTGGGEKTISVKGEFQAATTNFVIRARESDLGVIEWKEVKSL